MQGFNEKELKNAARIEPEHETCHTRAFNHYTTDATQAIRQSAVFNSS